MYDLTSKGDWRTSTEGAHMKGPIDHVAKNKAAFSDVQQTLTTGTNYVDRGINTHPNQHSLTTTTFNVTNNKT